MLLVGHLGGHEDAHMVDAIIEGVDDGLLVRDDLAMARIQIGDPVQRLG
jgi:hypothetical protein